MSGSHKALDRFWRVVPALLPCCRHLADFQKSLWVRDGATQGRIMEQGMSVSLGRGSNAIAKPKQTKITVGTGHR